MSTVSFKPSRRPSSPSSSSSLTDVVFTSTYLPLASQLRNNIKEAERVFIEAVAAATTTADKKYIQRMRRTMDETRIKANIIEEIKRNEERAA